MAVQLYIVKCSTEKIQGSVKNPLIHGTKNAPGSAPGTFSITDTPRACSLESLG